MYIVRPFQPNEDEYAAVVNRYNIAWPDERPIAIEMVRENDRDWPAAALNQRFMVEDEGQIVASASCYALYWQHQPGTIHLSFDVHPSHTGQGVEDPIYHTLLAYLRTHTPELNILATSAREDRLDRVQFLEARNFQPAMRSPQSALDVPHFDATRFQTLSDKLAQQGLPIYTLTELYHQEPDWKQKLCDLRWAIIQDVPAVEPPTQPTLADFERMVLDDPALDPEAFFIAVDQHQARANGVGRLIGQSNL